MQNSKSKQESLWHIQLPNTPAKALTSTAICNPAPSAFVHFIHAALESLALSSFTQAIRANYLPSLSRLTTALVTAHPQHTIPTALGHLDQTRQGQKSTKRFVSLFPENPHDQVDDARPLPDTSIDNNAYTHVFTLTDTMHSDLTGKFQVTSFSGMQYIIVSGLDGYIHVEPLRTRHHLEYIAASKRTINFFAKLGRKPIFQRLDNETSHALETFARTDNISIQYCAPHQRRALRAERAIRTFKNHFIATLCTVAHDFPLALWDELLPQAELCLNHLLPYPSNTSISAYAGLHGGAFDFAAHPIAPAGTKVVIHDKPNTRGSLAPHGTHGYYLGPVQLHYRCYCVWATATRSVRVADTLAWFSQGLELPGPSPHDFICGAVTDLTQAINVAAAVPDSNIPMHPTGHVLLTLTDTLKQLAAMYPINCIPETVDCPDVLAHQLSVAEQRVPYDPLIIPELTAQIRRVSLDTPDTNNDPPITAAIETILSAIPEDQQPLTDSQQSQNVKAPQNTIHNPNTALVAHHRPRQNTARSPTPTDRVTRLDARRMSIIPTALQSSATLNLDEQGYPLKYRSAKNGPNKVQWQRAEGEEIQQLLGTGTIKPIHLAEQPIDRISDSTYYNPQVKEKAVLIAFAAQLVATALTIPVPPRHAQLRCR